MPSMEEAMEYNFDGIGHIVPNRSWSDRVAQIDRTSDSVTGKPTQEGIHRAKKQLCVAEF